MEKLGIEPFQLLTQFFNFFIMVFLLTKLLYKPILKMLDERKKKIEEGLKYTEKLKQQVEANEKKRKEIIEQAKNEARKIIEEGKKSGKKLEEEIIEKAHKEATLIIEKNKKELDIDRQQLERQLKKQAVEIAQLMAKKTLEQVLSSTDQKAIIDKKIKEISKLSE